MNFTSSRSPAAFSSRHIIPRRNGVMYVVDADEALIDAFAMGAVAGRRSRPVRGVTAAVVAGCFAATGAAVPLSAATCSRKLAERLSADMLFFTGAGDANCLLLASADSLLECAGRT